MQVGSGGTAGPSGPIRGPQSFVAGLALVALAAFAIWATRDLPQGTLRAMGPAMLPRWLAIGVGMCGAALAVSGLFKRGDALHRSDYTGMLAIIAVAAAATAVSYVVGRSFVLVGLILFYALVVLLFVLAFQQNAWLAKSGLREPFFVIAGILTFAITIRPFAVDTLTTPALGLLFAGPLAIFIGGNATPEVRWRELLILALALTAFCMVLFGDLLNLPIPLFPQWFADLYPAGWSNDARLRMTAGALVLGAVLIYLAGHATGRREPIDVATHSGVAGERERI